MLAGTLPRIESTEADGKWMKTQLYLDLRGIHWVIVGGESGPGARPIEEEWVLDARDRCVDAHVAFFFKQWRAFARDVRNVSLKQVKRGQPS